jgi:hypothetical protein
MLQRSLAASVASLLLVMTAAAAEDREFTGREAEAIALATNTFKSEQRKDPKFYGDLKHYTVFLERKGEQVDVIFVPQRSPRPANIPKTEPYLEFGGSTVHGSEVHYIIFLDRMKILKEHYAR